MLLKLIPAHDKEGWFQIGDICLFILVDLLLSLLVSDDLFPWLVTAVILRDDHVIHATLVVERLEHRFDLMRLIYDILRFKIGSLLENLVECKILTTLPELFLIEGLRTHVLSYRVKLIDFIATASARRLHALGHDSAHLDRSVLGRHKGM